MSSDMWTKEELEMILEKHFLFNGEAFSPGRTNDDMVDSMCICFALDREWTELFAKWVDNYTVNLGKREYIDHKGNRAYGSVYCPRKEPEITRILQHYERVKKWLEDKEAWGEPRGNFSKTDGIMRYAINY